MISFNYNTANLIASRSLSYELQATTNFHRLRYFFVITIFLLSSGLLSSVPAQTTPPQQTSVAPARDEPLKKSTVHGRVIYEDTRRPLRRVEVVIYDPASKGLTRHLTAWTDGRGEFQIANVPVGKYFVMVDAPGIIRTAIYDSEERQKDITSVTVDGSSSSDVIVRVKRGGAISGRVTYADGDPAVNASLKILRKQEGKWTPVHIVGPSGDEPLTDERGVYRISGLMTGEYLVGANEEKRGIELSARDEPAGGYMLNRASLPTTYYDGATSLSGATTLAIQAGEEQKDINITLAERSVHGISGTVTLKGNTTPVARARVSIKVKDESSTFASEREDPVTNTDEQGRFAFDEVQDGDYTIAITPPRWYGRSEDLPTASQVALAGKMFVTKTQEVTVAGADLAGLEIEVSRGSRISGTVAVEGGKALPPMVLVHASTDVRQATSYIRVLADGTFTLEGVPSGTTYLRTSVPPDNKYYTKSVIVGKTELLRGPIVVKEDEEITKVRIVISPDVAVLSGRVLAADGKTPKPGATVVLLSTDIDQQKSGSARLFGYTNADGSFRLSGAPGDYLAIVMRPGEPFYELSNDALRLRNPKAQRLVLQAGENERVDIVAPSEK